MATRLASPDEQRDDPDIDNGFDNGSFVDNTVMASNKKGHIM